MAKKKQYIHVPKELLDDLQEFGNQVAKHIAIAARDNLTEAYYQAIDCFYMSYTPDYYRRRFTLYEAGNKYYTNAHGKIYYGGVIISPEKMRNVHQDPNYQILDLSLHGWHGHPSQDIYTTPPLDLVYRARDAFVENIDTYTAEAMRYAKSNGRYSILFK